MFAKNIRFLRKRRNWLQKDLAQKLGYKSAAAINKWEVGEAVPPYKMISQISNLFNVPEHDLMNIDIEKQEHDALTNTDNVSLPAARPVPILGTICAGEGIDAIENYDGLFFIDNAVKADLCLHVKGTSMIDVGIQDGDIAFIIKNCSYDNGRIYAVRFVEEDTAILRKLYWQEGDLILMPCNEAFDPIVSSEAQVQIIGALVGVYHELG